MLKLAKLMAMWLFLVPILACAGTNSTLDPKAILGASLDKMEKAGSYHMFTESKLEPLPTGVTSTASGDLDYIKDGQKTRGTVKNSLLLPPERKIIIIGQTAWEEQNGVWSEEPAPPGVEIIGDATVLLLPGNLGALRSLTELKRLDDEVVDNKKAYHLKGTGLGGTVDLWVEQTSSLILKISATGQGITGNFDLSITFSRIDQTTENIQPPSSFIPMKWTTHYSQTPTPSQ